jgi:hypothetical protein
MSETQEYVKVDSKRNRRLGAVERLEAQLKSQTKTEKGGFKQVPLTKGDEARIERQIQNLENKL